MLVLAPGASASNGGTHYFPPPAPLPGTATIVEGKAVAPATAPARVRHVIVAANRLVHKPYRWGGGHRSFLPPLAPGYDCSGAVSYALFGGRFLTAPLASGDLEKWAHPGVGRWITVYADKDHVYMVVAGLRFDTGMRDRDAPAPPTGPRWSTRARDPQGFVPRHPLGL